MNFRSQSWTAGQYRFSAEDYSAQAWFQYSLVSSIELAASSIVWAQNKNSANHSRYGTFHKYLASRPSATPRGRAAKTWNHNYHTLAFREPSSSQRALKIRKATVLGRANYVIAAQKLSQVTASQIALRNITFYPFSADVKVPEIISFSLLSSMNDHLITW